MSGYLYIPDSGYCQVLFWFHPSSRTVIGSRCSIRQLASSISLSPCAEILGLFSSESIPGD